MLLKTIVKVSGNLSVSAVWIEAAKQPTSSDPLLEVYVPLSDVSVGTTSTTAQVEEKVPPSGERRSKTSGGRNTR